MTSFEVQFKNTFGIDIWELKSQYRSLDSLQDSNINIQHKYLRFSQNFTSLYEFYVDFINFLWILCRFCRFLWSLCRFCRFLWILGPFDWFF